MSSHSDPQAQDDTLLKNTSIRGQLIATEIRLLSSNGFHRTSLDQIALETGVSKMTVFTASRSRSNS